MSGVRASFGGMLLLIGIHFHSSQTTAINDLVSATLGMKVGVFHCIYNAILEIKKVPVIMKCFGFPCKSPNRQIQYGDTPQLHVVDCNVEAFLS